jgi:hypothetical protein
VASGIGGRLPVPFLKGDLMIYVLMFCTFMSSSGEVCEDVKTFDTMQACVQERDHRDPIHKNFKCEARGE